MAEIVTLTRCNDYEEETVARALGEALAPLGGLDWVKPGMTVALKLNLVGPFSPKSAAITHPSLAVALTRMLREKGAKVVIGDSPGGPWLPSYLNAVYRTAGLFHAQEAGAVLNRNFTQKEADYPEAVSAKRFAYTAYLSEADAILNLCKLKSHGMMSLSAGVKNMFGAVPGTVKPEYHFRYPESARFANMLIDLNEYFHPVYCICDAVEAMEGNGPTAGTPRHIGALIA